MGKEVKKMARMKRKDITVDPDEWEKLKRNIDCTPSEWIRRQIKKQNECIDEVVEIDLRIKEIDNELSNLTFEKKELQERKDGIIKQRKLNEENFEVINNAMNTIRTVVYGGDGRDGQGYIELSRIKFIAKKKVLDSDVLIKQCKKETIEVKDLEIVKEEMTGLNTGKGSPF